MRIALQPDALELTVVIPALREAPNLARLLPAIEQTLSTLTDAWEILVVDGDSNDGTLETVAERGARVRCIVETRKGYGAAIMRGVSEARGRYVLTMDGDLSHPAEFVPNLWEARDEAEILIASRYVPGGEADQPAFRLFLSKILNYFFRSGLSMDVRDMSSGFRLYRKAVFSQIDLEFTNFAILVEILLKAFANGARIHETPFHYALRTEGNSHARVLPFGRDYLRLFHRMWRIRNSVDFPDYDWRAYDSRIWFQRYWQRRRHAIILGFLDGCASICDVGCGSSRILADLPPDTIGVDMRHDKLAFMRRTNRRLVGGDGLALPFRSAQFDCVLSSQVIEHIPDENGRHLDELVRVLRPGGRLVIGTPDYGGWQWPLIERIYARVAPGAYADEHVTHYTHASLRAAIEARGCRVEEHAYICGGELILRAVKQTDATSPSA